MPSLKPCFDAEAMGGGEVDPRLTARGLEVDASLDGFLQHGRLSLRYFVDIRPVRQAASIAAQRNPSPSSARPRLVRGR